MTEGKKNLLKTGVRIANAYAIGRATGIIAGVSMACRKTKIGAVVDYALMLGAAEIGGLALGEYADKKIDKLFPDSELD